jgi:hypothetical protein
VILKGGFSASLQKATASVCQSALISCRVDEKTALVGSSESVTGLFSHDRHLVQWTSEGASLTIHRAIADEMILAWLLETRFISVLPVPGGKR